MRNYLISLARRGAGLSPAQSPQPSRTPSFSAEPGETKTGAADSSLGEFESVSNEPGVNGSVQEETPHETTRERLENNSGSASDSSRARPAELSQESPQVLPDVGGEAETRAQRDEVGRAPLRIRQAPPSPVAVETAGKDKALDLSSISKPDETSPLRPSQSTLTTATPNSSTALEREIEPPAVSDSVEEGAPVIPEPQAIGTLLRGSRLVEAVPDEKEPRIEVHIGRVEVRFAQTPTPPARQPSRPRGFNEYALARRYLDRNWY